MTVIQAGISKIKAKVESLITFLRHSKKTIMLILIVAVATTLVNTIIFMWLGRFQGLHLPNISPLYTIGVKAYWDANLENQTTEIQWGTIYSGTSNNVTLYLQSVSNVKTILELNPTNWAFLNSKNATVSGPSDKTPYMNLTWNYDNTPISPQETIQVTLILKTENSSTFTQFLIDNNINQFSFDIIIIALRTD